MMAGGDATPRIFQNLKMDGQSLSDANIKHILSSQFGGRSSCIPATPRGSGGGWRMNDANGRFSGPTMPFCPQLKDRYTVFPRGASQPSPRLPDAYLPQRQTSQQITVGTDSRYLAAKILDHNHIGYDDVASTGDQPIDRASKEITNSADGLTKSNEDPQNANNKSDKPYISPLRILTGRVKRVKAWINYQLNFPIIYVIHGRLLATMQSLVSPGSSGASVTRKTFVLVDPEDPAQKIRCVFYEIDRRLDFLDSGVSVKVTGKHQDDGSIMCFSVVPITDIETEAYLSRLENFAIRGIRLGMENNEDKENCDLAVHSDYVG